ncbi:MAG TPA: 2,3-bisphosphoglycerate-independent phosphoglycerate mutase [Bacillota bacterium]|nr:2,3-bisphosphoglycerate-independent phosphoglycerate mutase [Bacillota bacterium]HOB86177.1 2,3-bisphosphoglycerate-independent phosphoglycerate mutase [Bacillota bacterium]HOP68154.1 2,3-bisphosphoglycerate-independent phosphoglycerate mutase [Bacillota bacterium]HPT33024.1 2,3-bisphosphoglycerate-independent phosphoglycerate mutase [Bacillota bacterium]HQD06365.1 2,3-bisphosphoglycerate-independent phosphoglycerate mutase [Bacillota bacterium]
MKPLALIILDGWGYSTNQKYNAIMAAHTPNMDRFYKENPWALLEANGEAVGLPEGQMGNSEVGHLNIGAGRIVYQELTRISRAIRTGDFFKNPALLQALDHASASGGAVHLMGLVSDGGVHSHLDHLLALLELTEKAGLERVFVHAILDGRDTPPRSARPYLETLYRRSLDRRHGPLATICGRYYAMDRDKRYERTAKAYQAYVYGRGRTAPDPLTALEEAYRREEGDEFVQPTVIVDGENSPLATIGPRDSVIFFNFRADRARQICHALVDREFPFFDRGPNPPFPFLVTMTEYDVELEVPIAFPPEYLRGILGEVYSSHGLKQLRVAETEKYAHVTFFFNGGREEPFPGEERILVPSPKVATYDLQPEMSAPQVARAALEAMAAGRHALLVVNFANADMVGHTGIMAAAVRAVETVDRCLGEIERAAKRLGWSLVICADHGNAEQMAYPQGGSHTAHTGNPVPFIVIDPEAPPLRPGGLLADVAPTVLELAGLAPSPEMTGTSMLLPR